MRTVKFSSVPETFEVELKSQEFTTEPGQHRFIPLGEMAGEVLSDPIIKEATGALKPGGGVADARDVDAIVRANQELLTLHELIAHRLVQILLGLHRGRTFA